ncbi:MAG: hypothetical protein LBD93_01730 [Treponema sp.]|jgi:hypothetical protein|nr:hypothetical protein [Treponema sp.]
MNALTQELLDLLTFVYNKDYAYEYWKNCGAQEVVKKYIDRNEWDVVYQQKEGVCAISYYRIFESTQQKAFKEGNVQPAEAAGIDKRLVKDLDWWEFKWKEFQKKITREQYQTFVDTWKSVVTTLQKAYLERWDYPNGWPTRALFDPPSLGASSGRNLHR